jgi:hypothetical protein
MLSRSAVKLYEHQSNGEWKVKSHIFVREQPSAHLISNRFLSDPSGPQLEYLGCHLVPYTA